LDNRPGLLFADSQAGSRQRIKLGRQKRPVIQSIIVIPVFPTILRRVSRLTKQEQWVLCILFSLLLVGWAVKAYRTAHPPATASEQAKN
jgi:hypothetical protein